MSLRYCARLRRDRRSLQRSSKRSGFTLLELLVAAAILAVLLSAVAMYFSRQIKLNRAAEAQAQVQDNVRMVMQLVTTDLLQAGSRAYVTTGAVSDVKLPSVVLQGGGSTVRDSLDLSYVSSLRSSSDACRAVEYGWSGTTLLRSDQTCPSDLSFPSPSYSDLASHILVLDLKFQCSDGTVVADANCGSSFVRSVDVAVMGQSDNPVAGRQEAVTYGGTSCPQDYTCFLLKQRVLTPNLKFIKELPTP